MYNTAITTQVIDLMHHCLFATIQDKELKIIGQMYKKYFKQLTFWMNFCYIFVAIIFNYLIISSI